MKDRIRQVAMSDLQLKIAAEAMLRNTQSDIHNEHRENAVSLQPVIDLVRNRSVRLPLFPESQK